MPFFSNNTNNKETTQPLTQDNDHDHWYQAAAEGQRLPLFAVAQDSAHPATLLKEKARALRRQRCLVGTAVVTLGLLVMILMVASLVAVVRWSRHG